MIAPNPCAAPRWLSRHMRTGFLHHLERGLNLGSLWLEKPFWNPDVSVPWGYLVFALEKLVNDVLILYGQTCVSSAL